MNGLIEGRCVHYVAYNGRHLAAMVIGVETQGDLGIVDLVVFTNMANVNGVKNFGMQFHQGIAHSERGASGTWHYLQHEGGHE